MARMAPGAPRRKVWSDGSCVHPLDPLLARAAWGIRVQGADEAADPTDFAGPVAGTQTAQRAEVAAAVAAARAVSQRIELVSDSKWVVQSIAALAAGANPAEWRHADLWAVLEPYVRQGNVTLGGLRRIRPLTSMRKKAYWRKIGRVTMLLTTMQRLLLLRGYHQLRSK